MDQKPSVCPLIRVAGTLIRSRSRDDLLSAYHRILGEGLPEKLAAKYLPPLLHHWRCQQSGLEWFSPTHLGDSDYYEFLGKLPWYYSVDSWDKDRALQLLVQLGSRSALEVGCGSGKFLQRITSNGIDALGVEINTEAIQEARKKSLPVYHADDPEWRCTPVETLVLLQCLEHVEKPVEFLRSYLDLPCVRRAIIAVPCSESILSRSSDPLVWPPHHATLWSLRAFRTLAGILNVRLVTWEYQPNYWWWFNQQARLQPERRLLGLPPWPEKKLGRVMFELARLARISWARYAHSILVVFEKA